MTLPRKCVSLLLIYCFAVAVAPHPSLSVSANNTYTAKQETSDDDNGLRFRLSEGTEQPETRPTKRTLQRYLCYQLQWTQNLFKKRLNFCAVLACPSNHAGYGRQAECRRMGSKEKSAQSIWPNRARHYACGVTPVGAGLCKRESMLMDGLAMNL